MVHCRVGNGSTPEGDTVIHYTSLALALASSAYVRTYVHDKDIIRIEYTTLMTITYYEFCALAPHTQDSIIMYKVCLSVQQHSLEKRQPNTHVNIYLFFLDQAP